ncbi:hypothetical protein [Occultella aeris]|uniref:hypothetical protein n=1 Tax=Occultella aeris TaxID=2761496 RepID=UPI0012EA469E|nr:hypothetical protein [Occultella aeris]
MRVGATFAGRHLMVREVQGVAGPQGGARHASALPHPDEQLTLDILGGALLERPTGTPRDDGGAGAAHVVRVDHLQAQAPRQGRCRYGTGAQRRRRCARAEEVAHDLGAGVTWKISAVRIRVTVRLGPAASISSSNRSCAAL